MQMLIDRYILKNATMEFPFQKQVQAVDICPLLVIPDNGAKTVWFLFPVQQASPKHQEFKHPLTVLLGVLNCDLGSLPDWKCTAAMTTADISCQASLAVVAQL